jgi:hypothetical protein
VQQYVQWCLDNASRSRQGAETRRLPPSSVEIAAMRRLGTIVCRFFFLDGRTKVDFSDQGCAGIPMVFVKILYPAGTLSEYQMLATYDSGYRHRNRDLPVSFKVMSRNELIRYRQTTCFFLFAYWYCTGTCFSSPSHNN